ncbi:hypothetical protein SLEP1_g23836 [Rubroshorea leprosula]|uniref:Glycosyl transferase CAP10 domain-containing protein n=1 Tax=Rubroshorea leprosula TaxID=152421 RepID=A0AAV5JJM7_9ROSI|nr:hypothetical protein SLEP1_g23836 [Rubroshorea leprosula]
MTLYVKSHFFDFFSRGLVPLQQYWPIRDDTKCPSLKFAVEWGNSHPDKVEVIRKAAVQFIQEDLKMDYVYDYMFHLLNEYAKLLKFKPGDPEGAVELCPERMACPETGKWREFMEESLVTSPSNSIPCTLPPAYDATEMQEFLESKANATRQVEMWEKEYWDHINLQLVQGPWPSRFGLVSSQSQHFLAALLSDEEFINNFSSESSRRLANRYRLLTNELIRAGVFFLESNAGLFFWMDLRPLLMEQTFDAELELWRVIVDDVKLNVSPGSSFHGLEPGWFRVCFANMDDETVYVALERIRAFVQTQKTVQPRSFSRTTYEENITCTPSTTYEENITCTPSEKMILEIISYFFTIISII